MNLESEIQSIKDRNARVEADKAWETSLTRKIGVAVMTYGVIVLVFFAIGTSQPFVDAIIPVCGFLISTLSLSFLRKIWEKYHAKR